MCCSVGCRCGRNPRRKPATPSAVRSDRRRAPRNSTARRRYVSSLRHVLRHSFAPDSPSSLPLPPSHFKRPQMTRHDCRSFPPVPCASSREETTANLLRRGRLPSSMPYMKHDHRAIHQGEQDPVVSEQAMPDDRVGERLGFRREGMPLRKLPKAVEISENPRDPSSAFADAPSEAIQSPIAIASSSAAGVIRTANFTSSARLPRLASNDHRTLRVKACGPP